MNRFLSLPHTLLVIRSLSQASGNISWRVLLKSGSLLVGWISMYHRRQQHSLISLGFGVVCFFFNINLFFFSLIDLENWSWVNNFVENPLREENGRKEKEPFS